MFPGQMITEAQVAGLTDKAAVAVRRVCGH
jgi:hypothetical protein